MTRVAELSGVDKEIAERVVRATLLNLGTRIDPGEAHDLAAQLPEAVGVAVDTLRRRGLIADSPRVLARDDRGQQAVGRGQLP